MRVNILNKLSVLILVCMLSSTVLAIDDSEVGLHLPDGFPDVTIQGLFINNRDVLVGCDDAGYCDFYIYGDVERGDEIEFGIELLAHEDNKLYFTVMNPEDDDDNEIYERTSMSVKANRVYTKRLNIKIPKKMDQELLNLRLMLSDRLHKDFIYNVGFEITAKQNDLSIYDVIFSGVVDGAGNPMVTAGRALLVTARIENIGSDDQDTIKLSAGIPELGIYDSGYIEDLESDESKSSKELFLQIPKTTPKGEYKLNIEVEYDSGRETIEKEYTVKVEGKTESEPEEQQVKTTIQAGPKIQSINPGEESIYHVAVTKRGAGTKTYTISADSGEWADVLVTNSVLVLGEGETGVAYVKVNAHENALPGKKLVQLVVKSENNVLKETALEANVLQNTHTGTEPKESTYDLVKMLQIGLIVLVIVLVIIGLIIGFSRLGSRKNDEEDQEDQDTYF